MMFKKQFLAYRKILIFQHGKKIPLLLASRDLIIVLNILTSTLVKKTRDFEIKGDYEKKSANKILLC